MCTLISGAFILSFIQPCLSCGLCDISLCSCLLLRHFQKGSSGILHLSNPSWNNNFSDLGMFFKLQLLTSTSKNICKLSSKCKFRIWCGKGYFVDCCMRRPFFNKFRNRASRSVDVSLISLGSLTEYYLSLTELSLAVAGVLLRNVSANKTFADIVILQDNLFA